MQEKWNDRPISFCFFSGENSNWIESIYQIIEIDNQYMTDCEGICAKLSPPLIQYQKPTTYEFVAVGCIVFFFSIIVGILAFTYFWIGVIVLIIFGVIKFLL